MKTAVDSSVLLDVLMGDPTFGPASREALRSAYDHGALVACEVVWAEVRAHFAAAHPFQEALESWVSGSTRYRPMRPAWPVSSGATAGKSVPAPAATAQYLISSSGRTRKNRRRRS